jgi:CRP/FNR family transcriptional regulator, anaerobic regulatory protein
MHIDPKAFVAEPDLIEMLRDHTSPAVCEHDGPLFRQGEPAAGLYILHQGIVTLSVVSRSGESLYAAQALPGSLLGLPAVVSEKPYTLTATARTGAEISFLNRGVFTQLMLSRPQLSARILQVLAAQVRSARYGLS